MRVGGALSLLLAGCSLIDLDRLDRGSGGEGAFVVATTVTVASSASSTQASTSTASSSTSGGTTASGTMDYRDVVLSDEPVVYLRFEGSGPALFDEVSQSDVGTAVDAVAFGEAGAFEPISGKGVKLEGGHLLLDDDVPALWQDVAPYTVELWFNPNEDFIPANTFPRLFTRETSGPRNGIVLAMTQATIDASTCRLVWERFRDDEQDQAEVFDVPTTGFTYLVATFDGSVLRIFVNGDELASHAAVTSLDVTSPVKLGAIPGAASTRYLGLMDEVALYGKALSADRIAAHYAARLP